MTKKVIVKATCPTCGDISLPIDKIVLHILEGSNDEVGQYRFICPNCKTIVLKTTTSDTLALLLSSGAQKEYYNLSLEIFEHPKEEDAEVISLNDIIDLHFDLEENEEAWMSRIENIEE